MRFVLMRRIEPIFAEWQPRSAIDCLRGNCAGNQARKRMISQKNVGVGVEKRKV